MPDDAPPTASRIEANAILDQLEREEEEEARAAAAADEQDVQQQIAQVVDDPPKPRSSSLTPAVKPAVASVDAKGKAPQSKEFLSSFGSGFLNRGKGKGKAVANSAPAFATVSPAPASSSTNDPPAPVHEPHHHILPAPKSIYRPTPPPSAPNSRPNSPRPDRKVAFDVPATAEPKPAKQKRAAILLPPPPPHDAPDAPVDDAPKPPPPKKEPFVRPIKDLIVERPVRPPSAPKIRAALTPDPSLKTMAKPPKVPVANILERPTATPQSFAAPTNATATGPVHTLSLSGGQPSGSGEAAVHDGLIDEDDYEEPDPSDDGPSLSEGEDDSDSSGFYGNEDEEDEDELDIDSALHSREVALEYHRQRMNLGAGAGTGPLGGDADPGAYDSWNQPVRRSFSTITLSKLRQHPPAERPDGRDRRRAHAQQRPLLALPHRPPRVRADDHPDPPRPTSPHGPVRRLGRRGRSHGRGARQHRSHARAARRRAVRGWTERPEWSAGPEARCCCAVHLADAGSGAVGRSGHGEGQGAARG